ncbi:hypothetical protein EDC01DRAFT_635673 [Geopyxis carbonaria]|nr:hypothetical protein EDC01DRAFT_635673 [Geopyxis carbonaria]
MRWMAGVAVVAGVVAAAHTRPTPVGIPNVMTSATAAAAVILGPGWLADGPAVIGCVGSSTSAVARFVSFHACMHMPCQICPRAGARGMDSVEFVSFWCWGPGGLLKLAAHHTKK